ncbi:type II toxin-antitoxin system VapC family toxin [Bosea sp. (in: a-proteobacteria)]|uniref:type II toxin-antitoxin system VapC family toxin n=1 Tax=Bosea sp. (in: a-proteobacteria) TaxID=1871050 RepID=UPI002736AD27|nr:type II toxin-antitoxin system VapC family toxin [Bosea sp. (in: a-proteobacteria)]MDP3406669.1 type II toxin-antitoxin system VapC family toxin [Bosea sp. (in: a-proteobacteria)]
MQNADQLYLSALSVIEIKAGSEKLRGAGGERRAIDLDCWLERILTVAKIAGVLTEEARANGRHSGLSDVLIAGTTQTHERGLLTDNRRHFEPLRLSIRLFNPLQSNLPATD